MFSLYIPTVFFHFALKKRVPFSGQKVWIDFNRSSRLIISALTLLIGCF